MTNTKNKLYADENMVRLVALQVIIITVVVLLTRWWILAALLAVDFAIRAFTRWPSLLAAIAKSFARLTNQKTKPILAAPKKFAALLGFIFSSVIFLALFFNYSVIAYTVGGILLFCAALESFFNVCLGCYVFNWFIALLENRKFQKEKARQK